MEIKEIQDLIKFVAKSGVTEVSLEQDDFKITIKTGKEKEQTIVTLAQPQQMAMPQPVQQVPQAPMAVANEPAKPANEPANENLLTIKSPMIGTFYRSLSPDKPSFVDVGDEVKAGQAVCIIEAMKLFNEIESEISGRIVKVLVENASPVEYDQPLFLVEPI